VHFKTTSLNHGIRLFSSQTNRKAASFSASQSEPGEISGSQGGEYEDDSFLGYSAVKSN
jgi:hypothetical protein